jgi:hypothetical protein
VIELGGPARGEEVSSITGLLLLGGEAGVGKTSLVGRFVDTVPEGFRVLWGACDPLSTPRPLAPFQDMASLSTILQEQQGKHGLLTALLGELSVNTVMVVEDAHWLALHRQTRDRHAERRAGHVSR